jgi:hypothetical protein
MVSVSRLFMLIQINGTFTHRETCELKEKKSSFNNTS